MSRTSASSCRASSLHHLLGDTAEEAMARRVEHLDLDGVPGLHEGRLRLALLEGLDHPALGQAGDAARAVLVGDSAAAQQGARGEAARLAQVLDEVVEGEVHLPGVRVAHELAVE